jgi:hypothetical protein
VRILKLISLTVVELVKQIGRLPQTIAAAFRNSRRESELDQAEAERLDRIRHPYKYLGK